MTDQDQKELRAETIANARALLDFLEENPDVQVQMYSGMNMFVYTDNRDNVRAAMAASPGGWEKRDNEKLSYAEYSKRFGDKDSGTSAQYIVSVSKNATCQRVQTGTRHVEATEAYDEPVYEWKCGPEDSAEA